MGKILSEKKCGGTGSISEKAEALYVELNERVECTETVLKDCTQTDRKELRETVCISPHLSDTKIY